MLAAELCFRWGIADVEGWLNSVDSRVMNFWLAVDAVSPIGDEWRRTAEIKQLLSQLFGIIAATNGAKVETPSVDDCMPPQYLRAPAVTPVVDKTPITPEQEFAALGASLGFRVGG